MGRRFLYWERRPGLQPARRPAVGVCAEAACVGAPFFANGGAPGETWRGEGMYYHEMVNRRDIRRILGARVRELRQERGLSHTELGDRSGLSDMEVGFIENGSKPIRCEDLVCLATGLGLSPVAFFEGW